MRVFVRVSWVNQTAPFGYPTPMHPEIKPITYFIYARKSTESEDRQVASIDSQVAELTALARRDGFTVADVFSESQSAKAPGRPVFSKLLQKIHKQKANGILCWKLDRLARNPIDGGNISWMLQQGILQRIQTHERCYAPSDNVLMMSVEFGMANQFIRDLSQNVKRGLHAKVQQGWYPGVAKSGYMNDAVSIQGEKTTPIDPERFPLLKRAFGLILTGAYPPTHVLHKLNTEWGYLTPQKRKMGGKPLSRTTFYDILTDPFYYGLIEWPKGSGKLFQGKHEPLITEDEFWRIQQLLGKQGRPRGSVRTFAYTGLINCGECQAAITAETKEQTICSACKCKFASRNRLACPTCKTNITHMQHPKHLRYEYYHCTKRKNRSCSQGSITVQKLESQIADILDTITIPENIKEWALEVLTLKATQTAADRAPIIESLRQSNTDCQLRLNNLLQLKISPQNTNGELLSDTEFAEQRSALQREMEDIQRKIARVENDPDVWLINCAKTLNFACYAKKHFLNGTLKEKRAILSALGSNLTILDQKLSISLFSHFEFMQKMQQLIPAQNSRFEPKNFGSENTQSASFGDGLRAFLGDRDDVRTTFTGYFKKLEDSLEFFALPI
jgi:DNA invertase Pin-like site-specific DNA recombinase